jgi:methionyl-tRNA synthetase
LPFTACKLSGILKTDLNLSWKDVSERTDLLPSGNQIGQAEILFAQIEDVEIQKQIDKLEATKVANKAENKVIEPQKETSTFEDFSKLDLRVGTILEAEKMPKANKLLVLKVDTGIDVRTIVSGIAEHFSPEEVVGKRVTVLVNLAPRALRGVESQGMILMTNNAEGKLVFVNPSADGVENGAIIS